jgi:hypothetical protein
MFTGEGDEMGADSFIPQRRRGTEAKQWPGYQSLRCEGDRELIWNSGTQEIKEKKTCALIGK